MADEPKTTGAIAKLSRLRELKKGMAETHKKALIIEPAEAIHEFAAPLTGDVDDMFAPDLAGVGDSAPDPIAAAPEPKTAPKSRAASAKDDADENGDESLSAYFEALGLEQHPALDAKRKTEAEPETPPLDEEPIVSAPDVLVMPAPDLVLPNTELGDADPHKDPVSDEGPTSHEVSDKGTVSESAPIETAPEPPTPAEAKRSISAAPPKKKPEPGPATAKPASPRERLAALSEKGRDVSSADLWHDPVRTDDVLDAFALDASGLEPSAVIDALGGPQGATPDNASFDDAEPVGSVDANPVDANPADQGADIPNFDDLEHAPGGQRAAEPGTPSEPAQPSFGAADVEADIAAFEAQLERGMIEGETAEPEPVASMPGTDGLDLDDLAPGNAATSSEPNPDPATPDPATPDQATIVFDEDRAKLLTHVSEQMGCSVDDVVITAVDWYLDALFGEDNNTEEPG